MLHTHIPQASTQTETHSLAQIKAFFQHNLILHQDNYHRIAYVVMALMRVVSSLTDDQACHIVRTAWSEGRALIISCPKEIAEHYQDQLQRYSLTVTVEAA